MTGGDVETHLDGVQLGVGVPGPGRRVAGDLGGAHLAPPDRRGETHRVQVAQGVVTEDVDPGPRRLASLALFLGCRHRRLRPARVNAGPAIMAYRRVTRERLTTAALRS